MDARNEKIDNLLSWSSCSFQSTTQANVQEVVLHAVLTFLTLIIPHRNTAILWWSIDRILVRLHSLLALCKWCFDAASTPLSNTNNARKIVLSLVISPAILLFDILQASRGMKFFGDFTVAIGDEMKWKRNEREQELKEKGKIRLL